MREELKELWKFRELLWSMVERELRIRYKNSVLGVMWSFLSPLATTAVLTLVFGYLAPTGNVQNFSAYILAAYLPYLFFQQSVLDCSQSVLAQIPLVKKIYFPREILPLAMILSNFIHLLIGFVIFFLFLLTIWILHPGQSPFQVGTVWLPFLMLMSLAISTGFGLIVAALNTFYEDVKYMVSVLLYLLFFLSPVTYLEENVAYSRLNQDYGGWVFKLYHLNPLATLSTAYRHALLAPQGPKINNVVQKPIALNGFYIVWTAFLCLGSLVFGYWVFNKYKWRFVERP